jgi:hypothetical protein
MHDLRLTRSTAQNEDEPRPVPVLEPAGVALQPVVGNVSAPIVERGRGSREAADSPGSAELPQSPDASPIDNAPSVDLPWASLRRVPIPLTSAVGPLVVATAIAVATGNAGLGAGCGLVAWVIGQIGAFCRRVPFTFGEGFLGYRSDAAWPQGIQEDDDFRWNWRPRERSGDDVVAPQG